MDRRTTLFVDLERFICEALDDLKYVSTTLALILVKRHPFKFFLRVLSFAVGDDFDGFLEEQILGWFRFGLRRRSAVIIRIGALRGFDHSH